MNDKEILSALYDGELDLDQTRFALKRLGRQDVHTTECYAVIGACMRKEYVVLPQAGFADAVMAALDAPTEMNGSGRGQFIRWGAGFAVAASVAGVALFLIAPRSTQEGNGQVAMGQLAVESVLRTDDLRFDGPTMRASSTSQGSAIPLRSSSLGLPGSGFRPAGYNIVFDRPADQSGAVPWEQTVVFIDARTAPTR